MRVRLSRCGRRSLIEPRYCYVAETGHRPLPVRVERVEVVEFPQRLELEPCTSDDWELVELHAGYLEEELLRQVRRGTTRVCCPFSQVCMLL